MDFIEKSYVIYFEVKFFFMVKYFYMGIMLLIKVLIFTSKNFRLEIFSFFFFWDLIIKVKEVL